MITIQPAKNLSGRIDLPPSPDCFMLAAIVAVARQRAVHLSPAIDLPCVHEWETMLRGHATFEWSSEGCRVTPVSDDPSVRIAFPSTDLPHRDLVVFTLLGMGKTVVFATIGHKRCTAWAEQAQRLGYRLVAGTYEETTCLSLGDAIPAISADQAVVDSNDVAPLLGLLLGSSSKRTFLVDTPLVSPLRTIGTAFGFSIEAKNTQPRERDEVAKRLRLMQQKSRRAQSGQQFSITADFSPESDPSALPVISLTLPGDEVAGAVFTVAKCLFPRSPLVIDNLPLESWATPLLSFIRNMGCKVAVQETGRTTFGSVGMLQLQTSRLTGRKMECTPAVQYIPFLPSMVVIASFAEGESVFRELADLRLDTPDGIERIEACIRLLGCHHGEMPDGIVLKGGKNYDGFDIAAPLPAWCVAPFAVAGLRCIGTTTVNNDLLEKRMPWFTTMLSNNVEYRR